MVSRLEEMFFPTFRINPTTTVLGLFLRWSSVKKKVLVYVSTRRGALVSRVVSSKQVGRGRDLSGGPFFLLSSFLDPLLFAGPWAY